MSNYLDNYRPGQERLAEFIAKYPDFRVKTHVLTESLARECDVYIVKAEIYRTEADNEAWTTGISTEIKQKQYALELAESGAVFRALNFAGFFAKETDKASSQSHQKPIQTVNKKLAEFVEEQRPNDPAPIVWDVDAIVEELGAEIIEEIPLCNHGAMVLKTGMKEGKEYRGWVCGARNKAEQCPAKWMRKDDKGVWFFGR